VRIVVIGGVTMLADGSLAWLVTRTINRRA
jgi:hypothetical protein